MRDLEVSLEALLSGLMDINAFQSIVIRTLLLPPNMLVIRHKLLLLVIVLVVTIWPQVVSDVFSREILDRQKEVSCWLSFFLKKKDAHGNIRIWDTVNEEHILKNECRPISGKICDVAWDSDSKRIIAVGEGKESFGHAFAYDTLSSVGEITGHSKVINSVSIRQQRPYRAVTASDDMTVSFFHGVPFKHAKTIRDHTRFVHAVQFSPNGDLFVSAGADGKIFLYDGKTGDKIDELTTAEGSHKGSVFALSWSPDSTQLLSSSADYTAKIWDINTKSVVK